jgi:hypothetical protein
MVCQCFDKDFFLSLQLAYQLTEDVGDAVWRTIEKRYFQCDGFVLAF